MAMEENNKERPKRPPTFLAVPVSVLFYGRGWEKLNNDLILNTVAGPHTPRGWSCSKGGSCHYIVAPFAPCLLFLLVSLPPLSLPPGAPPPSINSLFKLDCFTKLSYVVASEPNAFKSIIAIFKKRSFAAAAAATAAVVQAVVAIVASSPANFLQA
jgi:hypothetical protein